MFQRRVSVHGGGGRYPSLWSLVPSGGYPSLVPGPFQGVLLSGPRSFRGLAQDRSTLSARTGVPPNQNMGTPPPGKDTLRVVRLLLFHTGGLSFVYLCPF